jgi:YbbR domain-containing protein
MVLGPRNVLDNIGRAYIDINLKDSASDYMGNLPVKLENKVGTPIYNEWINIQPGSVEVFLPIVRDQITKTVPIIYELEGKTAEGYEIKSINIYPQTVVISSEDEDVLFNTNYIPVKILLNDSRETIKKELLLSYPDGVKPVNDYTVKIIVEIGPKD